MEVSRSAKGGASHLIHLTNSTHSNLADAVLQNVIETFENKFSKRIRTYYIEGSYADASTVNSSDIDVLLVFRHEFKDEEQQQAETLAERLVAESVLELDIGFVDEQSLIHGVTPMLKFGSSLIYGEDIRDALPLIPLVEWTRERMHSSLWRTVHLYNRSSIIRYPLTYPEPNGEFYGYDARMLRLPNGQEVHCTRDLIRLTGWSATAMIAFKAGRYVARKSECHRMYQACFDDEWGQLLQDIYRLCRGKWNYLIPENSEDRHTLKAICERTLGFENHFLQVYKKFVLSELRNADPRGVLQVLSVLQKIVYQDEEILAAIARVRAEL